MPCRCSTLTPSGASAPATHARVESFFFNDTETTEIYTSSHTLSLHDALPISADSENPVSESGLGQHHGCDYRSEEHTSELQSRELISYAVFCLKKKKKTA